MKLKTLIFATAFGAAAFSANGAICTWTGTNSTLWSDPLNWSGGVPVNDLVTSVARWENEYSGMNRTVSISASQSVAAMRFNIGDIVLNMADGVALTLKSATFVSTSANTITNTINGTIKIAPTAGNVTLLTASASNSLYVRAFDFADIDSSALRTITLLNGANSVVTISQFLNGSSNHRIAKNGTGTLVLNGENAASTLEGLRVAGGTLSIQANNALASTSPYASQIASTTAAAIMLDLNGLSLTNTISVFNSSYAGGGSGVMIGTNLTSGSVTIDKLYLAYASLTGDAVQIKADGTSVVNITKSVEDQSSSAAGRQGGIEKIGTGTLVMNGAAFYTRGTTVSAGTLIMKGRGDTATGDSFNVTVAGGAVYGCAMYIDGALALKAANSVLTLNAAEFGAGTVSFSAGSMDVSNGGTVHIDIGDQITVVGALTAGSGVITLNLTDAGVGVGTYTLITFGSSAGLDLSDLNVTVNGSAIDPERYEMLLDSTTLSVSVIPEPALAAALLGALGLCAAVRRRR